MFFIVTWGVIPGFIDFTLSISKRITVVAFLYDPVYLFRRPVVPLGISAIIYSPEFSCGRVPIKADRIAQAAGIYFSLPVLRVDLKDGSYFHIILFTVIAFCANRNVQHAIWPKGNSSVGVLSTAGHIIDEHFRIPNGS